MSKRFLDAVRQGKNAWWRYLLSVLLIVVFWLGLGSIPLVIWLVADQFTDNILTVPIEDDQILKYVVFSLSFCFLLLSIFLAVTVIHQRPFRSLISPDSTFRIRRVLQGSGVWLLLIAATYLIEVGINPSHFELTFEPKVWLIFLPLAIVFTPVQTISEELLFRGYIVQGLSLLVKNQWLLIGLSSVFFGVLHLSNPEVRSTNSPIWLALTYIAFGVFLVLVTLRDNSLELAIGCHTANNFFLATLVRDKVSVLDTPAVFTRLVSPNAQVEFFLFLMQAIVFYYIFFGRRERGVRG